MKKIFVALSLLALVAVVTSCKEKRCSCTTVRGDNMYTSHSLEPLGNHSSCSELDREWLASDSSGDMLFKTCVPEGD